MDRTAYSMLPGLPDRKYNKRPMTASICAFSLINEELWICLGSCHTSPGHLLLFGLHPWMMMEAELWNSWSSIGSGASLPVHVLSLLCVCACLSIKLVTMERGKGKTLLGPHYALMLLLRHFAPVRTVQIVSTAHKRSKWNAIGNMASQHVYANTYIFFPVQKPVSERNWGQEVISYLLITPHWEWIEEFLAKVGIVRYWHANLGVFKCAAECLLTISKFWET